MYGLRTKSGYRFRAEVLVRLGVFLRVSSASSFLMWLEIMLMWATVYYVNVEYCFRHLSDCDPLVVGRRGFFGVVGAICPCGVLGVLCRFFLLVELALCVMVVV